MKTTTEYSAKVYDDTTPTPHPSIEIWERLIIRLKKLEANGSITNKGGDGSWAHFKSTKTNKWVTVRSREDFEKYGQPDERFYTSVNATFWISETNK